MEQVLSKNFLECSYYNLRLESESSRTSEGDTESVLSLQGKETDLAQDTPDTDTKSEYSSDSDIYEFEYEVASLSGDNNPLAEDTSSGSEDVLMGAAIAAAICDVSMEAWITDAEDSDTSLEEIGLGQTDFSTCIQCKSRNDNPRFSYCDKCFQRCWQCKMRKNFSGFPLCSVCYKARKTLFPPRPRRVRPRNKKPPVINKNVKKQHPIALANLRSCLSGLSQDSGVGSSQELPKLNLDDIVVPKHLTTNANRKRTVSDASDSLFSDTDPETNNRKRAKIDEETGTKGTKRKHEEEEGEHGDEKKLKIDDTTKEEVTKNDDEGVVPSSSGASGTTEPTINSESVNGKTKLGDRTNVPNENRPNGLSEPKELCIVCNAHPKNSIFLHGKTGHMCCCYRCAVRTWHAVKSCPICKMKVQNVVKVFVCN